MKIIAADSNEWPVKSNEPVLKWNKDGSFGYEERPRYIFNDYPNRYRANIASVFANMEYHPTTESVRDVMLRAFNAAGMKVMLKDVRLVTWSGETNTFWHADVEVIP